MCLSKNPARQSQRPGTRTAHSASLKGSKPSVSGPPRSSALCFIALRGRGTPLGETSFYPNNNNYMQAPSPDAEGMDVREYEMEPGDAVAFNYKTRHGARGNESDTRRRAFSLRLLGDDARYVERLGPTSPPYPGHEMTAGQRLRTDWFPMLLDAENSRA